VGVVDPGPSLRVEVCRGLEPDPASVVEGFPVALFDFAVVVPAEQAAVCLVGAAAWCPGDQVMNLGP